MGRLFERIREHSDDYYASSEGYAHAKQKKESQDMALKVCVVCAVAGFLCFGFKKYLLGIILSALGVIGIVACIRSYRNQ